MRCAMRGDNRVARQFETHGLETLLEQCLGILALAAWVDVGEQAFVEPGDHAPHLLEATVDKDGAQNGFERV